jgi:hypothetical protein
MHVHIYSPEGEAKCWLEPVVSLHDFQGFSGRALRELQRVVEEHKDEIIKAWKKHFKS